MSKKQTQALKKAYVCLNGFATRGAQVTETLEVISDALEQPNLMNRDDLLKHVRLWVIGQCVVWNGPGLG